MTMSLVAHLFNLFFFVAITTLIIFVHSASCYVPYPSSCYTNTLTKLPQQPQQQRWVLFSTGKEKQQGPNDEKATSNEWENQQQRLPTSIQDQVRQASNAIKRATTQENIYRHSIRLLLPLIGATELDDWPGGARQMMQAASPLVTDILKQQQQQSNNKNMEISTSILDQSDGVVCLLGQASEAKDDACAILLPSADSIATIYQKVEPQVGTKRNLILVNGQWKRRSDFGTNRDEGNGFLGKLLGQTKSFASYVEEYHPTFYCSNMMVEGEQIRILRSYPGPWRIFIQYNNAATGDVSWNEIGTSDFISTKPIDWDNDPKNRRDGGRLFDYGKPTYQQVQDIITSMPGYQPKTLAEKATSALNFIKDTL